MEHCLGLATRTQISVCMSLFPSAGTTLSLFKTLLIPYHDIQLRKIQLHKVCVIQTRNVYSLCADLVTAGMCWSLTVYWLICLQHGRTVSESVYSDDVVGSVWCNLL